MDVAVQRMSARDLSAIDLSAATVSRSTLSTCRAALVCQVTPRPTVGRPAGATAARAVPAMAS
jgi:hypothetical protein